MTENVENVVLKMPVIVREGALDDEYKGFKFQYRRNFKTKILDDWDQGQGQQGLNDLLSKLLISWNLTDEEGHPLPQPKDNPAALAECSIEVKGMIIRKIMESIQNVPNLSSNS